MWVKERYGDIPLYITENGAAFYDPPTAIDGASTIRCASRTSREHLKAVHDAMRAGRRPARILCVVAARQPRVESRLLEALRNRARRLRHAGADDQIERQALFAKSSGRTEKCSSEIGRERVVIGQYLNVTAAGRLRTTSSPWSVRNRLSVRRSACSNALDQMATLTTTPPDGTRTPAVDRDFDVAPVAASCNRAAVVRRQSADLHARRLRATHFSGIPAPINERRSASRSYANMSSTERM